MYSISIFGLITPKRTSLFLCLVFEVWTDIMYISTAPYSKLSTKLETFAVATKSIAFTSQKFGGWVASEPRRCGQHISSYSKVRLDQAKLSHAPVSTTAPQFKEFQHHLALRSVNKLISHVRRQRTFHSQNTCCLFRKEKKKCSPRATDVFRKTANVLYANDAALFAV